MSIFGLFFVTIGGNKSRGLHIGLPKPGKGAEVATGLTGGRILIVDDDSWVNDVNRKALEKAGYTVEVAVSVNEARCDIDDFQPELIILDILLPDGSGLELCRELRGHPSIRTLVLSALNSSDDIINGLMLGADDYLTKPYSSEELLARVKVHLRRLNEAKSTLRERKIGNLTLNYVDETACVGQLDLQLEPKEFAILAVLAGCPGRKYPPQEIYDLVWGAGSEADLRTINIFITSLQAKLGNAGQVGVCLSGDSQSGYLLTVTK